MSAAMSAQFGTPFYVFASEVCLAQVGAAGVDTVCHAGPRGTAGAAVYALAEEGLILRPTPRCAAHARTAGAVTPNTSNGYSCGKKRATKQCSHIMPSKLYKVQMRMWQRVLAWQPAGAHATLACGAPAGADLASPASSHSGESRAVHPECRD